MKRKTTIFKSNSTLSEKRNFKTFDNFIQSNTHLNELIDGYLSETENRSFALIGLHSCGNLSNSIINLYLSNKNAEKSNNCKLLCNVACCYNLLNEKYTSDPGNGRDIEIEIDESSKFPISDFLNKKKYFLKFKVRNLACHSLDKVFDSLDDFREVISSLQSLHHLFCMNIAN